MTKASYNANSLSIRFLIGFRGVEKFEPQCSYERDGSMAPSAFTFLSKLSRVSCCATVAECETKLRLRHGTSTAFHGYLENLRPLWDAYIHGHRLDALLNTWIPRLPGERG